MTGIRPASVVHHASCGCRPYTFSLKDISCLTNNPNLKLLHTNVPLNRVGSHVVSVRIHCTEKWRTSFHTDVLSKSKYIFLHVFFHLFTESYTPFASPHFSRSNDVRISS